MPRLQLFLHIMFGKLDRKRLIVCYIHLTYSVGLSQQLMICSNRCAQTDQEKYLAVADPKSAQACAMPPWGIVATGIHGSSLDKMCHLSLALTAHLLADTNVQHQYMNLSEVVVIAVLVVMVAVVCGTGTGS